jgi:hypothetical protein
VPLPIIRPRQAEQPAPPAPPREAAASWPPAWLFSVGLISSASAEPLAEHQPRSFAAAESAIAAATSAPAAFAAPAITEAADSVLRSMAQTGANPMPPPRPQGIAPVQQ